MSKEIERKFLVSNDSYKDMAVASHHIMQAYLSREPRATVRVRLRDDKAYLTVKGINQGATRDEWEYEIPVDDARAMMSICTGRVIDKLRYIVPYAGHRWEVDVFSADHKGLVLAEVELPSEDTAVSLPPFVGDEVTGDPRYYNSVLAQ